MQATDAKSLDLLLPYRPPTHQSQLGPPKPRNLQMPMPSSALSSSLADPNRATEPLRPETKEFFNGPRFPVARTMSFLEIFTPPNPQIPLLNTAQLISFHNGQRHLRRQSHGLVQRAL
jgi:hypothetical protein